MILCCKTWTKCSRAQAGRQQPWVRSQLSTFNCVFAKSSSFLFLHVLRLTRPKRGIVLYQKCYKLSIMISRKKKRKSMRLSSFHPHFPFYIYFFLMTKNSFVASRRFIMKNFVAWQSLRMEKKLNKVQKNTNKKTIDAEMKQCHCRH